jgi:hypothetical protein
LPQTTTRDAIRTEMTYRGGNVIGAVSDGATLRHEAQLKGDQ